MFAVPVQVAGHTTKGGVTVKPHTAIRHKAEAPADHTRRHAAGQAAYREAYTAPANDPVHDKLAQFQERRDPDGIEQASHFYVSAIDGSRRHLVAGPYASHEAAKGMVEHVRKHADADPRAHFMAWGTAGSVKPLTTPLGADWRPAA